MAETAAAAATTTTDPVPSSVQERAASTTSQAGDKTWRDSFHGLTDTGKAGLGAGLGAGVVLLVLIVALVIFFGYRTRKNEEFEALRRRGGLDAAGDNDFHKNNNNNYLHHHHHHLSGNGNHSTLDGGFGTLAVPHSRSYHPDMAQPYLQTPAACRVVSTPAAVSTTRLLPGTGPRRGVGMAGYPRPPEAVELG
ncbi:hypothetical protein CDD83_9484 [Cordyceps sp. RAO-2017]|nr:hypothetical protein CDD83_9484 [Cordyceps sp. RAO-2017]